MNPRITVRYLPAPFKWGSPGKAMAYHHIIPFWALREVWNRLLDQHILTALPEARVAIRQYLVLSDRNVKGLDDLIDRMRAENTIQQRARHNQLQPLEVSDIDHLGALAVWPAWNIVEGPRQRSDPTESDIDRFSVGLTRQEAARMRSIESLFDVFQEFIDAGPAPGGNLLRELAQTLADVRPVLYCESPIRFRTEMWIQGADGRWRKRQAGE